MGVGRNGGVIKRWEGVGRVAVDCLASIVHEVMNVN